MNTQTHHRTATVNGNELFYREAGPADAPVIVLLHGYPTGSAMYRNLIPLLARRYRVVAPDMLGFGFSESPTVRQFDYSFDALTDLTVALLDQLHVTRYAIMVQDYGAPIGWRLALRQPNAITAVISQSGNGYDEGFVPSFWQPMWDYQANPSDPAATAAIREALTIEAIRWQYTHGVPDQSVVDPEVWHRDHAALQRPGNDEVQLALFRDYASNPPLYPRLHDWLRSSGVPLLAVWGRNDEIFGPAGAEAFARDASEAEVHLLDGGHFLLESSLAEVAELIMEFLERRLTNT